MTPSISYEDLVSYLPHFSESTLEPIVNETTSPETVEPVEVEEENVSTNENEHEEDIDLTLREILENEIEKIRIELIRECRDIIRQEISSSTIDTIMNPYNK